MRNNAFLELVKVVDSFDDKNYIISTIAYSAAPTVEGKKPSTVVNLGKNQRNLRVLWQKYKDYVAGSLGVSFFELRHTEESILVLIYKPKLLGNSLFKKSSMKLLRDYGYTDDMSILECLEHLKSRYSFGCPHEMGIFLGIPVDDVISFIENQGAKCLLCRYWKVYHNPRRAMCIFNAYDKAKSKMAYSIVNFFNDISQEKTFICAEGG